MVLITLTASASSYSSGSHVRPTQLISTAIAQMLAPASEAPEAWLNLEGLKLFVPA